MGDKHDQHKQRQQVSAERPIYLVHESALLAQDIAAQLQHFGYQVVVIDKLAQLQAAIDARAPAALLIGFGTSTAIAHAAEEVARIRQSTTTNVAVIFISGYNRFDARLATVRAGAIGYLPKPLDMVTLIDRLDALLQQNAAHAYRVLAVSSDAQASAGHVLALRSAGMEVRELHRIGDLLHALAEYRPELILMDVDLPGCDSTGLTRLIRQDNVYLGVPIIFLADDASLEKRLSAIEAGADDVLARHIRPEQLVAALTGHGKRYRALRQLIMSDSLTGLLNHSAIKEHLKREIARARRSHVPLTLAMIDIDHFKSINDTYGHPVGDQVIRALSRLLQQRLRRGDIIGRYGGEEFAVIMTDTPASSALNVLDQIRESFSCIRHHGERAEFTATFSAGVAELGADSDADGLFRITDAALYQAKHKGRNCVVLG